MAKTKNTKKVNDGPHPVDKHVGKRLRMRRSMLGMSQEELANGVDLTFQQIQKYESAANRISCSRIQEFSEILDVPVEYFFPAHSKKMKARASGLSDNKQEQLFDEDVLYKRETIALLKEYYSLEDKEKRKKLLNTIRSIVQTMKA